MDQVDSTQTASLWDPPGPWDFPPPPPPGRPGVSRDGPGTPWGRPDSLGIPRRAPRPLPGTSRTPPQIRVDIRSTRHKFGPAECAKRLN